MQTKMSEIHCLLAAGKVMQNLLVVTSRSRLQVKFRRGEMLHIDGLSITQTVNGELRDRGYLHRAYELH